LLHFDNSNTTYYYTSSNIIVFLKVLDGMFHHKFGRGFIPAIYVNSILYECIYQRSGCEDNRSGGIKANFIFPEAVELFGCSILEYNI